MRIGGGGGGSRREEVRGEGESAWSRFFPPPPPSWGYDGGVTGALRWRWCCGARMGEGFGDERRSRMRGRRRFLPGGEVEGAPALVVHLRASCRFHTVHAHGFAENSTCTCECGPSVKHIISVGDVRYAVSMNLH